MRKALLKNHIFCVLFGAYIAAVLWITLFSRLGTEMRNFLFPLQSYTEILEGNMNALVENLENVILFFPLGVFWGCAQTKNIKSATIVGLVASLCIEYAQLIFALGTFEVDDLIHNTFGMILGFLISEKINKKFRVKMNRQLSLFVLLSVLLFVSLPFGFKAVRHQQMIKYAAMNNREDGAENLLVLKGDSGYVGETSVYVKYLKNGSIRIKGKSDNRAWKRLAEMTLDPGVYTFAGLYGTDEQIVALELEYYNEEQQNFIRLTPDVGPVDEVKFELDKQTMIRAYVTVYEGCDCDVVAMPVIYKEE